MQPSKIDHESLATEVKRAQAGQLGAFHRLVVRFQDMAVGYAFSLLGDYHLAEDAAQEAFLDAFRKLPTLRHPEAFVSWLRTVVFKHCDRLRRCRPVTESLTEEDERLTADGMEPAMAAEQAEIARLSGRPSVRCRQASARWCRSTTSASAPAARWRPSSICR